LAENENFVGVAAQSARSRSSIAVGIGAVRIALGTQIAIARSDRPSAFDDGK
jgi:hypothetical protein